MAAYQNTNFAYQGTGLFAYQSAAVVDPTVILYGGDDAPRRKRRKRKTEEFYHDIERTIHALMHPTEAAVRESVEPVKADLGHKLEELLVLAQKSHESLRALGEIKRQVDAIARERYAQELEEEDELLMFL